MEARDTSASTDFAPSVFAHDAVALHQKIEALAYAAAFFPAPSLPPSDEYAGATAPRPHRSCSQQGYFLAHAIIVMVSQRFEQRTRNFSS